MAEGVGFPFPSLPLNEGRTYGQPEVVLISLPQVATVCAYACRARSVGGLSARPAHAAGGIFARGATFHAGCYAQGTLTQRVLRQIPFSFRKNVTCRKSKPDTAEWGKRSMAIFHYTVKIVGRSKGKSIISASAYLNGDVMKNEETGRISYYTSKKEVVYTSLLMCENAPQEWQNVPAENIRRFQKSVRYKRADNQNAALEKFKLTFQKQRLWNEVLRIEKSSDAQLGRSFEFSLPKEWSRQEQIDYTTEYIQKTFVDKGMCADWSIHDKGDGNPHVHLLVTLRPFNSDHSWGNKEIKDWEFVRDENGNIVVDESHPTGGRIKRTLTVMESESPYLMKMESRKSGQGTANSGNVY